MVQNGISGIVFEVGERWSTLMAEKGWVQADAFTESLPLLCLISPRLCV